MNASSSVLLTDLYQLTMLQAYFLEGLQAAASFEMYVRRLPPDRNFLLAAGLEQVLEYLETLHFTADELAWLRGCGRFRDDFLDYLRDLRFTGSVAALPEGTVFFADEPLIRIEAPLPQAQMVESRIINLLQFQTLIASKAARCVLVAPTRQLVDFGMRRAHGAEAALLAARASYLAGFAGTATVLAGRQFDIPLFGTMAHSYVLVHGSEREAFAAYAAANPDNVVLLLDTYDTEAAAAKVVELAPRLRAQGTAVRAVRLDSGDIAQHARAVRRILDEGGLKEVRIIASGNLDEYSLRDLVAAQAPVDGFGVGTRLDVSQDVPYLECAYKLQQYAGQPRRKRSEGKAHWPGTKQVYRRISQGRMMEDVVTRESDPQPGEPLLQRVMERGARLTPPSRLSEIRARSAENLSQLPPALRSLEPGSYPVRISQSLRDLARQTDQHQEG
jgi:nicotinate phosphoribosyltransferase